MVDIDSVATLGTYTRVAEHVLVHLFSTNEWMYVPRELVTPLLTQHPNYRDRSRASRSRPFLKAVQEVLAFLGEV